MVIGIDHGYGYVKTRNVIFGANVAGFNEQPAFIERTLEYAGMYYNVGGVPEGLAGNKTLNQDYYNLTLAAIAEELKARNESPVANITIGAGLPLTRFGAEKKDFEEYLLQKRQVDFKYEGRSHEIRIEDVKIYPQGYAAIIPILHKIPGSCYVVDIGTGTTDILPISSDKLPDLNNAKTIHHGMSTCISQVNEQINRTFSAEMMPAQIIDIILGKEVVTNPKAKAICEEAIQSFAEATLNILRQNKVNYMLTPTYIIGGGATLLEKYAKNINVEDTCITYIPDIRANAIGYEILCNAKKKA